jgi:predicted nucleic acid-binding protein
LSTVLGDPVYCDSSALVKLVLPERESGPLSTYLDDRSTQMASSELCEVELVRAVARANSNLIDPALDLLTRTVLLPATSSVKSRAAHLKPESIRSLDAIHVSTALEIQADLKVLVSYDRRLLEVAERFGIKTVSPGA